MSPEAALSEVKNNEMDGDIWARAYAESEGDTKKAKALYVSLRARYLEELCESRARIRDKNEAWLERVEREDSQRGEEQGKIWLEEREKIISSVSSRDKKLFYKMAAKYYFASMAFCFLALTWLLGFKLMFIIVPLSFFGAYFGFHLTVKWNEDSEEYGNVSNLWSKVERLGGMLLPVDVFRISFRCFSAVF